MLPPETRSVLTDALRPPPGAQFDRAVALTFTLDLDSALIVPLAFAAHTIRETSDPVTVLESVRRCADRVDIFCQAGQMRVPKQSTDLHAYLEKMVHSVRRPRPGRLFHPKLWALRFLDTENDCYLARLLVMSRNLTNDSSWDACLRLDGYVGTAPKAENKPIADLLRHTMTLATDLPDDRRPGIEKLVEDLRRVDWERPDGVTGLAFHAFGIPSAARPDFSGRRHLAVSPFCNEEGLVKVAASPAAFIVSRQEDLDRLPAEILEGREVFVLSELAGLPSEEAESTQGILTGLHAKLYVVEQGWDARVFVGSANATDAAFGGNVELLVELQGKRKTLGVDTMMGADAAFRGILEQYNRQPAVEVDDTQWVLDNFVRDVASVALTATVTAGDPAYTLTLASAEPLPLPPLPSLRLMAELLTRRGETVPLPGGSKASGDFRRLALVDISPFVIITAEDASGHSASTVVRATLIGDPEGRLDELLARQIDTPEKFLKFLALLLGFGVDSAFAAGLTPDAGGRWNAAGSSQGVLELLMRALVDHPEQLGDLANLVARLKSTERGNALLPAGFDALWSVIDEVRQELRQGASA